MKNLADSTPPSRRADRYTITRSPSRARTEIEDAQAEAVMIVRAGLWPYMRKHHLQMPPLSVELTFADMVRYQATHFKRQTKETIRKMARNT